LQLFTVTFSQSTYQVVNVIIATHDQIYIYAIFFLSGMVCKKK
jgi:hypothetical protein